MTDPTPRVRIAPSPTGPLHIGTARTALFNFLFTRHTGGTFVLRLEDTDQARGSIAYEQDILDGLHWLGLAWDEGPEVAGEAARGPYAPYRQMLRLPLYAEAAARLLAADRAYPCYCTPEELEADRKAQEAAKQPPRYVGRCAALTAADRAAREAEGRQGALRFGSGPGSSRSTTWSGATSRSMSPTSAAISSSSAPMERRCTTSRSWSTTPRWR